MGRKLPSEDGAEEGGRAKHVNDGLGTITNKHRGIYSVTWEPGKFANKEEVLNHRMFVQTCLINMIDATLSLFCGIVDSSKWLHSFTLYICIFATLMCLGARFGHGRLLEVRGAIGSRLHTWCYLSCYAIQCLSQAGCWYYER